MIANWAISSGYTFHSGAPVAWSADMIYYGGNLQYDPRNVNRAFDTAQFKTAVVRNVGSLGSPRRNCADARADHDQGTVALTGIGFAIGQ